MKKVILILIFAFILNGCATTKSVNLKYSQIDYQDGISKNEALYIAQKYFIEETFYPEITKKHFMLNNAMVSNQDDFWRVTFLSKTMNPLSRYFGASFLIDVDKNTGEVVGEGPTVEPKMKAFF